MDETLAESEIQWQGYSFTIGIIFFLISSFASVLNGSFSYLIFILTSFKLISRSSVDV
jgi:hypothetical protein